MREKKTIKKKRGKEIGNFKKSVEIELPRFGKGENNANIKIRTYK